MNKKLALAAYLAGAVAILWVGAGYMVGHPLALAVTLLIAAVYLLGGLELRRFQQATAALGDALAQLPEDGTRLQQWLAALPATLRHPVRLRIEGERAALPGPTLTPYLVGLLVMLGMLGTFLGMVVTLNGAVLALESTTDLATIRAALAAPVKGLGLAFGTSVAGVAASAMLGLVSALCRRERLAVGQGLDAGIAGGLRTFSLNHQRQETFRAIQAQSQALPAVAERLERLMASLEARSEALDSRLLAGQERFHQDIKTVYDGLARAVDASLKDSLQASAANAAAALQPVMSATLAGLARESGALQEKAAAAVDAQLAGIAARFDDAVARVAATWETAAARQAEQGALRQGALEQSLAGFADAFAARSAALLERLGTAQEALQQQLRQTLEDGARGIHQAAAEQARGTLEEIARLMEAAAAAPQATSGVIAQLQQLQAGQEARDAARQEALGQSLEAMAAALSREWQAAGSHALAQQQQICQTLEATARQLGEQSQAQAGRTLEEIGRLMESAAEAPRVAAEVIAELRQQLSASVVRDNEMLEERSRVLSTVHTLLEAINHASAEQRGAIDALIASTGTMLEQVGERFGRQVAEESARLGEAATQAAGGAVEVASLGEAFGGAVQQFGDSAGLLLQQLQRLESSLEGAMQRSDEQLAYYVAQAREIIDLSLLSQQRVVADLERLAGARAD